MAPGTECTQGEASEDHCWDHEGSEKDAGVDGSAQVQSKAQANSCKESKSSQKSQSFLLSFMAVRCCHQPNHQPQRAQGREQASLSDPESIIKYLKLSNLSYRRLYWIKIFT